MKLTILTQVLSIKQPIKVADVDITSIESDSRQVTAGTLFVAVKGTLSDGHDYIDKAIDSGAIAIVCEQTPSTQREGVSYIEVANSAEALGLLASAWYGNPSQQLQLVGVTGTNGKTTIATLLYDLVRKFGKKAGLLSTVCNYVDGEAFPATHTTPDPLTLNKLLRAMVDAGCEYAIMEVSSHSVDQRRIAGLEFDGGIFTNLTRDHLDYHHTVEEYLKAKKRFFDDLSASAFAISNADDKVGKVMLQNSAARPYYYSLRTLADYKGRIIESHFDGTLLDINGREVMVRFAGRFNAYNLLAVYAAACQLGFDSQEVLIQMSTLVPVSGRFQIVQSSGGVNCIVDYAHTPDALINVLSTIADVLGDNGEIITVVGCGGNRDKGKRPIMAREAVQRSGRVIITSDNPRNEDPADIINDMLAGLDITDRKRVLTIADRREAIRTAIALAKPSDVVLIAGKGHETYQEIQGVRHHFDDKEEVVQN